MTETADITARISQDVAKLLDRLGKEVDRSRAWIISTAVERYVREELEFIEFIQEGERDIAEGRIVSHENVMARFGVKRGERHAA